MQQHHWKTISFRVTTGAVFLFEKSPLKVRQSVGEDLQLQRTVLFQVLLYFCLSMECGLSF